MTKHNLVTVSAVVGCVALAACWAFPPSHQHDLDPAANNPPTQSPRRIATGTWKQNAGPGQVGERWLRVTGEGEGQLVLRFDGLSAFAVGSGEVVIDTCWEVEDEFVTFTLIRGEPDGSYRRLLTFTLDEVTQFRIEEFREDRLVLVRVTDGEVFEWLPDSASAETTRNSH